jgi:hypothetical protein
VRAGGLTSDQLEAGICKLCFGELVWSCWGIHFAVLLLFRNDGNRSAEAMTIFSVIQLVCFHSHGSSMVSVLGFTYSNQFGSLWVL